MNAHVWNAISRDYFSEIISPFQPGVINPLRKFLGKLPRRKRLNVGDLGCGIGNLLPFLCPRFKKVYAVDFAKGMLDQCRQRHAFRNLKYVQRSIADLKPLHGKLDVAVAVNSVLSPSLSEVDRILLEISKTLKPGGHFMGIFPSMESIIYQGTLILERETERSGDADEAARRARRILEEKKYDFVAGKYSEDRQTQKLYYSFELRMRLKKAGFQGIRLGKVLYPWDGVGSHESFPGKPMMWDWFVRARMPEMTAPSE